MIGNDYSKATAQAKAIFGRCPSDLNHSELRLLHELRDDEKTAKAFAATARRAGTAKTAEELVGIVEGLHYAKHSYGTAGCRLYWSVRWTIGKRILKLNLDFSGFGAMADAKHNDPEAEDRIRRIREGMAQKSDDVLAYDLVEASGMAAQGLLTAESYEAIYNAIGMAMRDHRLKPLNPPRFARHEDAMRFRRGKHSAERLLAACRYEAIGY